MNIRFLFFFLLLLPTSFIFTQDHLEAKIKVNYRAEMTSTNKVSTDTLSAFETELMPYEDLFLMERLSTPLMPTLKQEVRPS